MKFAANRYMRLLPSVMLVCGGLLVLNASGIVHEAYALEENSSSTDAMAAAPAPINKDYAGDDAQVASASEVDVLTSLSKRRTELDAREAQIAVQANMLAATEARVDAKIAQLKTLQGQIAALLGQRDQAQKDQIASLIQTYKNMPAKKAAPIFEALPDQVLVPVAQGMKPGDLAAIMQFMSSDGAQKLSVKLANKLALPDTTQALAPVAAPSPGPSGSIAPGTPGNPAAPGPLAANATAPAAQATAQAASTTPATAKAPAAKADAPKSGG